MRLHGKNPLAGKQIYARSHVPNHPHVGIADSARVIRSPRNLSGSSQIIAEIGSGREGGDLGFDVCVAFSDCRRIESLLFETQISRAVKDCLYHFSIGRDAPQERLGLRASRSVLQVVYLIIQRNDFARNQFHCNRGLTGACRHCESCGNE
jgi:hypothetical protein